MLEVKDLQFGYTDAPLYAGVNFIVAEGQKVGLVGPNGSGKSTLLKILTGKEDGYKGKIKINGKLAQVPQEVKHDSDLESATTAREYVDPSNEHTIFELKRMFAGLELDVELSARPLNFSGGQKTKLALAKALLSNPDILLLDEPTNFMDSTGKQWVMHFLSHYSGSVVIISHDLELMDKHIDKVLSVNPATKTIEEYKGNYSQFIKLKKEKDELLKRPNM